MTGSAKVGGAVRPGLRDDQLLVESAHLPAQRFGSTRVRCLVDPGSGFRFQRAELNGRLLECASARAGARGQRGA